MNKIWNKFRPLIRSAFRVYKGLNGFIYDSKRYLFYGGWRTNLKNLEIRNYNTAMVYHGLEKSLSYKKRNPKSGWRNAEILFNHLKIAIKNGALGFHDIAGKQVLQKFIDLPENSKLNRSIEMRKELLLMKFNSEQIHGTKIFTINHFHNGILKNPENFFLSRFSLREFNNKKISETDFLRVFNLAIKTPSVCNRQAWHVYFSTEDKTIQKALSFQNGNKPFGEKIPNLLIITVDLKAFFSGNEHYQHWIDGGLMSMSLMYAFHSLGIATCALNWSQSPKIDKKTRKILDIKPEHTIIMMMAAGYPNKENKVCSSVRRPIEEVFSKLQLKK